MVSVDPKFLQKNRASAPPPQIIEIGYEGDIIYGKNIELALARAPVPIMVAYKQPDEISNFNDIAPAAGGDAATTPQQEYYTLKTKQAGNSKLSQLLFDFATTKSPSNLYEDLEIIETADGAGQRQTKYNALNQNPKNAYAKCQAFADNAIPCTLEVTVPLTQ